MYECVRQGVQYVLAGSIRDDGPLVDVITDCVRAQKQYIAALEEVAVVLMLASTLHSIAVGNLLKGSVKTVCVDINEATPMKLSNRGSKQAIGIVTDVSFFSASSLANSRGTSRKLWGSHLYHVSRIAHHEMREL